MVAQQLIYEHFMDRVYGGVEENLRCFLIPNFGHRWWKTKGYELRSARFALVVEIDAGPVEAELYAEVEAAIEALNVIQTVV